MWCVQHLHRKTEGWGAFLPLSNDPCSWGVWTETRASWGPPRQHHHLARQPSCQRKILPDTTQTEKIPHKLAPYFYLLLSILIYLALTVDKSSRRTDPRQVKLKHYHTQKAFPHFASCLSVKNPTKRTFSPFTRKELYFTKEAEGEKTHL